MAAVAAAAAGSPAPAPAKPVDKDKKALCQADLSKIEVSRRELEVRMNYLKGKLQDLASAEDAARDRLDAERKELKRVSRTVGQWRKSYGAQELHVEESLRAKEESLESVETADEILTRFYADHAAGQTLGGGGLGVGVLGDAAVPTATTAGDAANLDLTESPAATLRRQQFDRFFPDAPPTWHGSYTYQQAYVSKILGLLGKLKALYGGSVSGLKDTKAKVTDEYHNMETLWVSTRRKVKGRLRADKHHLKESTKEEESMKEVQMKEMEAALQQTKDRLSEILTSCADVLAERKPASNAAASQVLSAGAVVGKPLGSSKTALAAQAPPKQDAAGSRAA